MASKRSLSPKVWKSTRRLPARDVALEKKRLSGYRLDLRFHSPEQHQVLDVLEGRRTWIPCHSETTNLCLSRYVRYSMREVHLQPKSSCQAKDLAIQRIEIFPTPFTRSNLHIFRLSLQRWIQLIQGYNYVFQSMWGSRRAGIDPGGGRCWQREIEQSKPSISPFSFAESNLHIFPLFWIVELVSIDSTISVIESSSFEDIFAKFEAGGRLTGVQLTDRRAKRIGAGGIWERHLPTWRSGIRGSLPIAPSQAGSFFGFQSTGDVYSSWFVVLIPF